MEVEYDGEEEVKVKCPKCKNKWIEKFTYSGYTDIEPIPNEGYD